MKITFFYIFFTFLCYTLQSLEHTMKREKKFKPRVKFNKTDLKKRLTYNQYQTAVRSIDQPTHSGVIWDEFDDGNFNCVVCNEIVFNSIDKFDDDRGHATFYAPIGDVAHTQTIFKKGKSEVRCANCGAYLGRYYSRTPVHRNIPIYFIMSNSVNFVHSSNRLTHKIARVKPRIIDVLLPED